MLGQISRFQTAINPKGYPGGTFVTPVQSPSFTSNNKYNEFALYAADNWSIKSRVRLNLGLRYEYYGPQTKSEPKYDSNFYYGDANVSVSTSTTQQIIDGVRSGSPLPTNQSPIGALWKSDWNNFAPRVGVGLGRDRRRQDQRPRRLRDGLRAELRQCHLQRALQPAGVPGGLD